MTAEKLPRFDIAALKRLAGNAFVRGEAYHREGRVEILAIEPRRVLAQVAGTEDYRVNLLGKGETIKGECDCPAFDDYGFCKHMVATAIAANEIDSGPEPVGAGALARIRAHLADKPNGVLVAMIVELAERDRALFRKLEIASAAEGADDKTLAARLGKAIDRATATRGYVEYGEAGGWAAGVEEALDVLGALDSRHDRIVLTLAEHAIDRIESAIESIDDSNGECTVLLERARDIHIRAARGARPAPIALARALFERETGDGYGTFEGAAWLYAEILGEAGLAEYRRLATEAWEKLPPLTGRGREKAEGDYFGLSGILDSFAERDGDVEARIALRAKDLSSPWKYLELAEFCLGHEGANEALRWAEEGLWTFEDAPSDARLVLFAANLLMKADRRGEAEAVLKRAFERAPDFNVYLRWREAGGEAAFDQALALVERRAAAETGVFFGHPADLGVKILMHEGRFETAWTMTRKYRVSRTVKEGLARESDAGHPREALEVYARRVDELANEGGNHAYEEAAGLIARMGRLRD
ncbi:MAG TPA: SWIM zinc finger family protein, partial [Roseiarcus sp.]